MASVLSSNASQGILQSTGTLAETAVPSVAGGATRLLLGPVGVANGINVLATQLEGKILQVRLAMKVTGATTTNFTMKLYWNSAANTNLTTFTSDIAIAATTAIAVNTITSMFTMAADLVWDSTSQRLMGAFEYFTTNTGAFTAKAATTVATGVTSSDKIVFFTTGTFSAANAGNINTTTDFTINLV